MILRKMTADYGRLDRETLTLREGLNVLEAPNESGKSTWASFLLSMLYGVDTSRRATRTTLPDKVRFQPWSGRPMAGRIELCWQGREITLERSSGGRAPLGEFRAFDTGTGAAAGLTAADCGLRLLGVERSVYERSGFLRQRALTVTGDDALEARLQALVTSGDEAVGGGRALEVLRELRGRCSRGRNGLLPRAEAALEQVRGQRGQLRQLGVEIMELQARLQDLEARRSRLLQAAGQRRAAARAERLQLLSDARSAWEKQRGFLAEKAATVAGLPDGETLQALLRRLDVLQETGAQLRQASGPPEPPPPLPCPPALEGLDAEGVSRQASADVQRLAALPKRPWLWPVLLAAAAAAALTAGIALPELRPWLTAAPGVFGALAVLTVLRGRRARAERRSLLSSYGAADEAGLRRAADAHREALLRRERQAAEETAVRRALDDRQAQWRAQVRALLDEVRAFAPEAETAEAARAALRRGIHLRQFHAAAQREEAQARTRYEAVRDAVGPLPEGADPDAPSPAGADPDTPSPAGADPDGRLASVQRELEAVRTQLDLRRGRLEASGDPAALAAQEEALTGEIAALRRRMAALDLAVDALGRAEEGMRARFAPQINRLAGDYLARLTGDRYDRVLLERDMTVRVRQAGETVTRPPAALSDGAADQLYLAVRLAVCEAVLPPDAPLVLDDALLAFDDRRMAAAMELLQELAQRRQILLFTCQRRERAWLEDHGKGGAVL